MKISNNVRMVTMCIKTLFPVFIAVFLVKPFSVANADQCLKLSGPSYVLVDESASYSASGSVDGGYTYTSTSELLSIDPNTGEVWTSDDPSGVESGEELDVVDSDGNTGSLDITIFNVTNETEATSPSNTERTLLGVYEKVHLGVVPELLSVVPAWNLSGIGSLSPSPIDASTTVSSAVLTYQAPLLPSSTEEIDVSVGDGHATLLFSVIAPSGVLLTLDHEVIREKLPLSLEVKANIYIQPDSVNFGKVYFCEGTCPAVTTGYFHSGPGAFTDAHPASVIGVSGSTVVPGAGTAISSFDTIDCDTVGASYLPGGTWTWTIPQYYVQTAGTSPSGPPFCSVVHKATLSAVSADGEDATLTLQKSAVDDFVTNP